MIMNLFNFFQINNHQEKGEDSLSLLMFIGCEYYYKYQNCLFMSSESSFPVKNLVAETNLWLFLTA